MDVSLILERDTPAVVRKNTADTSSIYVVPVYETGRGFSATAGVDC